MTPSEIWGGTKTRDWAMPGRGPDWPMYRLRRVPLTVPRSGVATQTSPRTAQLGSIRRLL